MVLLSGFGLVVTMLWLSVMLTQSFIYEDTPSQVLMSPQLSCDVWNWLVWVLYPMVVAPYIIRSYRIVRIFHVNSDVVIINPRYWNKLVIRESTLVKTFLFTLACSITARGIFFFSQEQFDLPAWGCGNTAMPMFTICLNLLEICASIYVIFRLRSIRDDYGISFELITVSSIWFLTTVASIFTLLMKTGTIPLNNRLARYDYVKVQSALVIARSAMMLFVSVVWPVFQTYSSPFIPLWSNSDALRSLDTLLKDIVCIQYFRTFLSMEAEVEYILCWVEVELFKDFADDPESLRIHAGQIYDKYLKYGAEFEVDVGLSPMQRQELLRYINAQPDARIFDEIQHELYNIMNTEFPRFLASESCRQCLQELEKEEHLRRVLEQSDMI